MFLLKVVNASSWSALIRPRTWTRYWKRAGYSPTPVDKVTGLFAMNVDPEEAARHYRERVVGPYRELLPKSAVESIQEQLSGACTVEIAAFDEFAKLLGDPAQQSTSTT